MTFGQFFLYWITCTVLWNGGWWLVGAIVKGLAR